MTPSIDPQRAMPAFAAMPTAAVAMTDVALATAQRTFALHVELLDGLVGLAIARSRRAACDPTGALRDMLLGPAGFEPAWRWATGLAAIGQGAAASLVSLATAQARGATDELDGLSRDARDEAARSAAGVASATNAAMTHGFAAVGELAGSVAEASLHSATDGAMRAAADVAMAARGATEGHDLRSNGRADGPPPRARAASKSSGAARSSASGGRGRATATRDRGAKAEQGAKGRGAKRGAPRGRG